MKSSNSNRVHAGRFLRVLGTTLGVLLFAVSLFAQGNFGRILGTVTDQTGAVLPGATVTVMDVERGLNRTLTTDAAGEYNAPNLIPGNYTVRVEAAGFKRLDRQNVVVEVGKEVRVDVTPQPGEQTQTVTVTEAVPLVDAASATLGGTLNNAQVNDMPLNGRNYQNLLSLRPGVQIQPGGSPWTQSTNNSRPDDTVWMVDGVINANFYDYRPIAGMPSPFTDGATILPIDAIQEFNLEENPKAEFGWRPGAIVNVGIRSGTNTVHGSAYAFGRDTAFAARNAFNVGVSPDGTCIRGTASLCDKLPTQLEQFGGVAGGAIKKDKLFFFGGYEGLRSTVGNAFPSVVPELASQVNINGHGPAGDPTNSIPDAINLLISKGIPVNAVSSQLLGCGKPGAFTFPCTGGLIQGASPNTTTYISSFPNSNTSDNGVGKLDYRVNDKHMLNGTLFIGNYLGDGEDHPVTSSIWKDQSPIRTYTITGNWVWTASSRLVNEARYGFNQTSFALIPDDGTKLANGTDYVLNTGITSTGGFPNIKVGGFQPGGAQMLGSWRGRPINFTNPFSDFQDSLSYLIGKHALKFGGEFTHILNDFNVHDTRGEVDFTKNQAFQGSNGLQDFLAGLPGKGSQLVGTTPRELTWNNTAFFVQDDWRISSKLILNLGLRYSYVSPMKEANNLIGSFDPTLGMVQQGQSGFSTLYKAEKNDWSPRVGFAYDVNGKGTTVIRGGFSKIYSIFTTAQFTQSPFQNFKGGSFAAVPTGACKTTVAPGAQCPQNFGGTINQGVANLTASSFNWGNASVPTFPSGAQVACTVAQACNLTTVNHNLTYPYMLNWSLGVQHAFNPNLSLEVGYVGTHGNNLTNFVDLNQINPATGVRPFTTQFPYLQFINQTVNNGRSNFDSLQTTLTKRVSHGVSFTAGYTYAHGLDNGSLSRFGSLPQNSLDPGAEYGNGDADIRHRFTLTGSWDIPGKKGFGQLLEGWKLNTIITLQSGLPWLVNDQGNDFSGSGDLGDRWNFSGNPSDFTSGNQSLPYCTGPTGCFTQSGITGLVSTFSDSQSAAMWAKCTAASPDLGTLNTGGCYVKGNSVMLPPKAGTYGTMGRNIFRDSGFKNMDLSLFKNFAFKERYNAQFRVEMFNVFNHPIIANPYGSANGYGGGNDPSSGNFGCGCTTPDVAAGNPLVGSGSSRVMQLGFKFTF